MSQATDELRMPTFIYLACTAPGWLNGSTEPQMGAVPFDSKMVPYVMHAGWAPHVRRYDGVIVATSAELEPGAKESLQALLNKPVYQIGLVVYVLQVLFSTRSKIFQTKAAIFRGNVAISAPTLRCQPAQTSRSRHYFILEWMLQ